MSLRLGERSTVGGVAPRLLTSVCLALALVSATKAPEAHVVLVDDPPDLGDDWPNVVTLSSGELANLVTNLITANNVAKTPLPFSGNGITTPLIVGGANFWVFEAGPGAAQYNGLAVAHHVVLHPKFLADFATSNNELWARFLGVLFHELTHLSWNYWLHSVALLTLPVGSPELAIAECHAGINQAQCAEMFANHCSARAMCAAYCAVLESGLWSLAPELLAEYERRRRKEQQNAKDCKAESDSCGGPPPWPPANYCMPGTGSAPPLPPHEPAEPPEEPEDPYEPPELDPETGEPPEDIPPCVCEEEEEEEGQ